VHTICRCVALIVCTIWIEYRTAINVRHVNDLRGVLPLTKTRHEFLIRAGIFWYLMYYHMSVCGLSFNKTCAFRNPNPPARNNPYSTAGSTRPHTPDSSCTSDRDRTSATPVESLGLLG
jgi:hypothetical protein